MTTSDAYLLYVAKLSWLSHDVVLAVGGTAFGEICIWRCAVGVPSKQASRYRQAHLFTAHEGSIFGVDVIHISLEGHDNVPKILLASCSDDRKIKIWDISDLVQSASGRHENERGIKFQRIEAVREPLIWSWAHGSRIWNVMFDAHDMVSLPDGALITLFSSGEDASCQSWRLNIPQDVGNCAVAPTRLEPRGSLWTHAGKNIWSSQILRASDRLFLATGGADGSLITNAHGNDNSLPRPASNPVNENSSSPQFEVIGSPVRVRSFAWIGSASLLAVTAFGEVCLGTVAPLGGVPRSLGSIAEAPRLRWQLIRSLVDLKKFSIIVGGVSASVALIASLYGDVYGFDLASLTFHPLCSFAGKISSLVATSIVTTGGSSEDHAQVSTANQVIVAATYIKGNTLDLHLLESSPSGLLYVGVIGTLESTDGTNIISILSVRVSSKLALTVLGLRSGCMIFCSMKLPDASDGPSAEGSPMQLSPRIMHYHNDAVTSIQLIRRTASFIEQDGSSYILSTSRDATYAVGRFNMTNLSRNFSIVHRSKPPFGPQIESAMIDHVSESLYLSGFNGKNFTIYDESHHHSVSELACEGAHRNWAFSPNENDCRQPGGVFAQTRNEALYYNVMPKARKGTVEGGGHGREIKTCAISPVPVDIGGRPSTVIATGAEDTDIRLFLLPSSRGDEHSGELKCIRIIRKHNTGVQHLQWSPCGQYLLSSGGNEEFFAWRIAAVPLVEIGTVLEATLPPLSPLPDLRITNFHVVADTQYDVRDLESNGCMFLIGMAFSDSSVRVSCPVAQSPEQLLM